MPFSTPFENIVICPLADGQSELLDSVPQETQTGWDSLRERWLVRDEAAGLDPAAAVAARFVRGTQIAGKNMWIVSRAPRLLARGYFEVEVTSLGLLSSRGMKVNYDSSSTSQSAENVSTPDGTFANVSTNEASPTCELEYILLGTVPSSTAFPTFKTGRQYDPPAPWKPAVPDSVWDALAEFTYNWPNGWVFDGARAENLPGLSTVHLVRERYRYQYPITP